MEKKILTASLRNRLFSDRPSVAIAFEYANDLITSMNDSADRVSALTALHVVCNTIANAIDALELPADNPAAGVTGFEDALIKIIDARIKYSLDDIDLTDVVSEYIENNPSALDLESQIQHYIDNSVDFTEIVRDEIRHNISFSIEVD